MNIKTMYSGQELQLEHMLDIWGEWLKTGNIINLGFPRVSMEYKILMGTANRDKGVRYQYTESNLVAEQIEAMVVRMHHKHVSWAAALRARYKHGICAGSSVLGKKFGIPARTFEDRVRHAKIYLRGMLDGIQDDDFERPSAKIFYISGRRNTG